MTYGLSADVARCARLAHALGLFIALVRPGRPIKNASRVTPPVATPASSTEDSLAVWRQGPPCSQIPVITNRGHLAPNDARVGLPFNLAPSRGKPAAVWLTLETPMGSDFVPPPRAHVSSA